MPASTAATGVSPMVDREAERGVLRRKEREEEGQDLKGE